MAYFLVHVAPAVAAELEKVEEHRADVARRLNLHVRNEGVVPPGEGLHHSVGVEEWVLQDLPYVRPQGSVSLKQPPCQVHSMHPFQRSCFAFLKDRLL